MSHVHWHRGLQSFVFGLASYFSYWFGLRAIHYFWPHKVRSDITFLRALTNSTVSFSFREIAVVAAVAVLMACIVTLASHFKLLNRFARFLRLTRKFGELDVWGYLMNMKEVVWVTVRDHKNDLIYDGWVQAFSDDSKDAELLLRDVSLYRNSTGEPLYQAGAVYISRSREDISIECRTLPIDERVKWKEYEDGKE